jgi:large subunit ribosomal protein L25
MSDFFTLNAQKREKTGKGICRRMRAAGQIPAIFYTAGGRNTLISVNEKDLLRVYGKVRRTMVFNLEIASQNSQETHPALIWDIDYFPAKNRIQHVDILGVDLNKNITIRVPLEFNGTAKGTKVGGTLTVQHEVAAISGKPLLLPQKISVDISELGLNDSIRVKDLSLPEGVYMELEDETVIVAVTTGRDPKKEEAETESSAAAS